MIIHMDNFLAMPALLIAWIIDAYFLLAAVRFICGRFSNMGSAVVLRRMDAFLDAPPSAASRFLSRHSKRRLPAWVPWALVLAVAIACRCLVIRALF